MIVANPSAVRAIAEAKIKTDKIDARMLASLLRVGLIPEVYVPTEEVRSQKILWRERIWLVRMHVRTPSNHGQAISWNQVFRRRTLKAARLLN
jgi:transposase